MIPLLSNLAPPVLAALLALTGAGKLFGRGTALLAAGTVLVRVLGDARRAGLVLRAVGGAELAVAAALLAGPAAGLPALVPGAATAGLGAAFTAYLGYARATAPESSCGCSARAEGPIGPRTFARAGAVLLGGVAAAGADASWWSQAASRPVGSALVVAAAAALLFVVSADLDRSWLLPLRRLRIRLFGHPLATGAAGRVPVEASVQLLESSLAWQAASPIVRSSLLDHWDDEGWRVLRFSGVYEEAVRGARPVSVLFALDLAASIDTAPSPAVRVSVIDDDTEEVVPLDLLAAAGRRSALPLAN
ncbi:MauE/DoxX family redox-associated membrane protein [Streptomyces sp. V4-01]|uniref:MauE/DoxX family redox-associated membrane protein n=1 Tax=Actinacidiphila polyblastidii TaxID=3110430 RepID=A0ABU7P900_9ACTN|nr:MauE/DoxX family redox-associated membrane protein [Streptomyces sp. V4-01]